ncbi:sulfite exporter TauE/SafE family protein [Siphonobacter sp.]|uniref:sulfite exporter TauE/SafE family protein n=1 Tax=Siphonobacter sp. TaxID=1869184 RepID=UPI003B3BC3A3
MSSLELAGYSASVLIGVSLGLIGGGGSILTLPVLVYLLGINPFISTVYSMFVVGTTALVGSVGYMRQHQVDYKAAAIFALPSFLAVFLTRKYLVPAIPDPLIILPTFILSKNVAFMILFAIVMLVASYSMIRQADASPNELPLSFNGKLLAFEGILVGILTGIIGAGGGFLIIPALALLAHLPMKTAVGTSLLIIALNTSVGFISGISMVPIDWSFLLLFTAFAIGGIFLGMYLAQFVSGERLKKAFGWFVLLMGLYIMVREMSL